MYCTIKRETIENVIVMLIKSICTYGVLNIFLMRL